MLAVYKIAEGAALHVFLVYSCRAATPSCASTNEHFNQFIFNELA